MIDFEPTPEQEEAINTAHNYAQELFRPISRHYDEHEHESPRELIDKTWEERNKGTLALGLDVTAALRIEELCWGDAGLFLCVPGPGLGGAAIFASGTKEQLSRFLGSFNEGDPKWGAMAMTEPHAGSDTAAISAAAVSFLISIAFSFLGAILCVCRLPFAQWYPAGPAILRAMLRKPLAREGAMAETHRRRWPQPGQRDPKAGVMAQACVAMLTSGMATQAWAMAPSD